MVLAMGQRENSWIIAQQNDTFFLMNMRQRREEKSYLEGSATLSSSKTSRTRQHKRSARWTALCVVES